MRGWREARSGREGVAALAGEAAAGEGRAAEGGLDGVRLPLALDLLAAVRRQVRPRAARLRPRAARGRLTRGVPWRGPHPATARAALVERGVVGGDAFEGFAAGEAGEVLEGGVGEGVGAAAQRREERRFAEAAGGEAALRQVEDAVQLRAQGGAVDEARPFAPDHQRAQFGGAEAVAVERGVRGEERRERGQLLHQARVEGGGREGVAHGLLADGAELERAARGEVLELEGPQPRHVGRRGREGEGAVRAGGGVPVFGVDPVAADVFEEGDGREVEVFPVALGAVDARGLEVAGEVRGGAQGDTVHPAVVGVEAVEAAAPEAVAAAEQDAARGGAEVEGRVGEDRGLEGLQGVEGVDGGGGGLFVQVELDLGGAGEEAEVGVVVEARGAAVFGVALEVVQEHPVAAVLDGLGAVLAPARVDAHPGQGVAARAERRLQRRVVAAEAVADGEERLVGAEGELEGVEGAVEGELVAGGGVAGPVEGAGVVARGLGEREAREEVGGGGVDGGEVRRLAGRERVDGQLQLDAGAPRAPPAQRREEARVEGGGEGRATVRRSR